MHTVEEFEINGHTVRIHPDSDGDGSGNPRDADNLGIMLATGHRNYELGDAEFADDEYRQAAAELAELIEDGRGAEFPAWATATLGATVVKPLWLLDHSGLAMRTAPFGEDPGNWDSGVVGFIFDTTVTRELIGVSGPEHIEQMLDSEVKQYDTYLQGDVYGYTIEDADGVEVDSCWGFLGLDYAKESATEAAQGLEVSTPTPPGLVAAVLTKAQKETVEHWQAYNVPTSWFVGQPAEDGSVEVLALGASDPKDGTPGFIWSIRIEADGTFTTSEATVGEFNTGIEI